MHEADVDQRHPGQSRTDKQQPRRDQLGRARSGCRRLGDVMMLAPLLAKLRERYPQAELAMTVRKVAVGQGLLDSDAAEWVK